MPADEPHPSLSAAARARTLVEAARDDPAKRLDLISETYRGPFGHAPKQVPFRRAALSFMNWQVRRGVLAPLTGQWPGSPWWRALNERLLLDGCESVARSGGSGGDPSSSTVEWWTRFIANPTASNWYRAHNATVVAGYLQHQNLAAQENEVERFFLNVVLLRVLYAHALVSAPRLALGWLSPLGRVLGDPRLGMAGIFMSLGRVLPDRYPAPGTVDTYLEAEQGLGRLLDYGVISPRLPALYEWSGQELDQPELLTLICDGNPGYAWPRTARRVWQPQKLTPGLRAVRLVTSVGAPYPRT